MAHADPSSELATKPLGRLLLRFAIPSIFAQIVNLLYNIVDRIFVGRIPEIGPLALAGLGVAFPIILIISSFSFLAGMGGAPLASIAMGRGDNAKAERILGSACVFLLAMSVVLTVLCFWAMRPMLLMFGASEQTIGYAVDYFSLYLLGTPAVQLSLGLNYYISCQGFAKTSMMTVLIGAALNIIRYSSTASIWAAKARRSPRFAARPSVPSGSSPSSSANARFCISAGNTCGWTSRNLCPSSCSAFPRSSSK